MNPGADTAQMTDELRAHVSPQSVQVKPGDAVLVQMAVAEILLAANVLCCRCETVVPSGRFGRIWQRARMYFELSALCEVGFSSAMLDDVTNRGSKSERAASRRVQTVTRDAGGIQAAANLAALPSMRIRGRHA